MNFNDLLNEFNESATTQIRKGLFEETNGDMRKMNELMRQLDNSPMSQMLTEAMGQQSPARDQMRTRFGQQPDTNDVNVNAASILRTPVDQRFGDGASLAQKDLKSQRFIDMIKTGKRRQEGNPLSMEELLMRFQTNPTNQY